MPTKDAMEFEVGLGRGNERDGGSAQSSRPHPVMSRFVWYPEVPPSFLYGVEGSVGKLLKFGDGLVINTVVPALCVL